VTRPPRPRPPYRPDGTGGVRVVDPGRPGHRRPPGAALRAGLWILVACGILACLAAAAAVIAEVIGAGRCGR
jgi:hypothetical protein